MTSDHVSDKCPVCNSTQTNSGLAMEVDGIRYEFCCPRCREQFVQDVQAEKIFSGRPGKD